MEHDIETILKAFNQHLLTYEKPLLTESQRTVLAWCLGHSNGSYQDIATASGYSANSLRDAGSKLFATIEAVLGKRVKKSTCGRVVQEWYRQKVLVENTKLLGREQDLQTLLNAITVEGRRLVCISGPPRIGKTYLVRHLKQQLLDLKAFVTSVESHCTQLPTVEAVNQHILASLENGYPTTAPHADDPIWQEAMDDLTPRERELMGWLLLHPDATVTWDDDGLWLNGQLCRSLEAALQALRKTGYAGHWGRPGGLSLVVGYL